MKSHLFSFLKNKQFPLYTDKRLYKHYYQIGKAIVAIHFHEGLQDRLGSSIEHIKREKPQKIDFEIYCLIVNPKFQFPFKKEDYRAQGLIQGYNDAEHFAAFQHGASVYSFYNSQSKQGYYLIKSLDHLPFWELSAPFRNIFHWWTSGTNYQLVHGAMIVFEDCGILLTGKGGSGKSSTTIGALLSGRKTIGEDYILVDTVFNTAYTLYRTGKLDQKAIGRFPMLDEMINTEIFLHQEKASFYLDDINAKALCKSTSIDFHFIPKIAEHELTTFQKVDHGQGLKSMAPSTIFQLPRLQEVSFEKCSYLCRHTPTYQILLGANSSEINGAIESFVKQHSIEQDQ